MRPNTMTLAAAVVAAVASLTLYSNVSFGQKLNGPVEIYVGANPGGGYDRSARAIQSVLEGKKLIDQPINVTYHPGGGGAVAWAAINRYPGDMSKLSVFSPNIVTNDILGASPQKFEDFSMLSIIAFEDGCFAVNPKGRIKTAKDLIAALKDDPSKLRFGFAVAAGNQWHVAMAKLAGAVGADITKVRSTVFSSGGKARSALLGEQTDVSVSGCASFAKYHESGDLKIVAVSSAKRQDEPLADVPTWRELGYNVVWGAWRGVLGPKGLSDAQIKFWETKLHEVVTDPSWKPIAKKNYWRTEYLDHKQTVELLGKQREEYRKTMKVLGLIK